MAWAEQHSLPVRLPIRNVSDRKRDYRTYYSAETRRLIADYYREDLEAFGDGVLVEPVLVVEAGHLDQQAVADLVAPEDVVAPPLDAEAAADALCALAPALAPRLSARRGAPRPRSAGRRPGPS